MRCHRKGDYESRKEKIRGIFGCHSEGGVKDGISSNGRLVVVDLIYGLLIVLGLMTVALYELELNFSFIFKSPQLLPFSGWKLRGFYSSIHDWAIRVCGSLGQVKVSQSLERSEEVGFTLERVIPIPSVRKQQNNYNTLPNDGL